MPRTQKQLLANDIVLLNDGFIAAHLHHQLKPLHLNYLQRAEQKINPVSAVSWSG